MPAPTIVSLDEYLDNMQKQITWWRQLADFAKSRGQVPLAMALYKVAEVIELQVIPEAKKFSFQDQN